VNAAQRKRFAAGSIIVHAGHEADSLFLIVAGEVEVYLLMANLARQLSEKLLRVEREMRLLGG
jgi:CRP-like cAMP-binding protein